MSLLLLLRTPDLFSLLYLLARRYEMNQMRQLSTYAYPVLFFMTDSGDHVSGKTELSPTVTLSKNGEAFATAAGVVYEVGNGWYKLAGAVADRDTLGTLAIHAEASGADDCDLVLQIVSWDPMESIETVRGTVNEILTDTGTTLPETLATIDGVVDDIVSSTGGTIPASISEINGLVDQILTDTGTTLPSLIEERFEMGPGAVAWTYNVKDNSGVNLAGVTVWVTTDAAGSTVIASGETNSAGNVVFYLDVGTVYVWSQKDGYMFNNPDTEVVS